MRKALSVVLFGLGGVSALASLFGMWFHVAVGPMHGPGLELGVGALVVSALCFYGAYWYGG